MKNDVDRQYMNVLKSAFNGDHITTRNSKVYRTFGKTMELDKTPLISIRKTAWKNALREWEWFMSGSSNIKDLHPKVHHWWEPWADKDGNIINNYSKQFRNAKGVCDKNGAIQIDQVANLIDGIKQHPNSRRNIITTWNAAEMNSNATPITNCHSTMIQAYVTGKDKDQYLNFYTYQRSADLVLGLPHNLIQMWSFLLYVSHHTKLIPGKLIWCGGDCHIYEDHLSVFKKMKNYSLTDIITPTLLYKPTSKEYKADDFTLHGNYSPIFLDKIRMTV